MELHHFTLVFGLSMIYLGHVVSEQNDSWETILSGCVIVAMGIFNVVSALEGMGILP